MRITAFAINVCLLALFAIQAQAAPESFRLAVDSSSFLSEEENRRARIWFEDVERRMPIEMKTRIGREVHVVFREMKVDVDSLLTCSSHATGKGQVLGYAKPPFLRSEVGQLVIAKELLSFFANEASRSQASCRHRRADAFAQAVVLHELGHIFDETGNFGLDEAFDRDQCATHGDQVEMLRSFDSCQEAITARGRISESAFYRRTSGFKPRAELFSSPRSPDSYESTHVREHFAVNFEYFILDPNYSCRRPHTARVLREIFPSVRAQTCELNRKVLDADTTDTLVLDPSRIYQVDYLQAGPGSALMSRWGHSMFRFIVCAPSRTAVDSECRKDTAFHLIIGFGAMTATGRFNNFAGVTGRYPSQLSILRYDAQVLKYTSLELRSLVSLPLLLTDQQKVALIENVLQTFWEYRGRYYFFSNNCSTETFRFLRSVLPMDHPIHATSVTPSMTPEGLLAVLEKSGLVDPSLRSESADHLRNGTYIPSAERTLIAAFSTVQLLSLAQGLAVGTYQEYGTLGATQRAEALSSATGRREIAAFLMLERWVGRVNQARFLERALSEGQATSIQALKFKNARQRLYESLAQEGEFGVPSVDALLVALRATDTQETEDLAITATLASYFLKHPNEKKEFEGTRQNILKLEKALASSIQSS